MNVREYFSRLPIRRPARRTPRGFALIVTLSLMTLLLLLVLTLTTLVKLNQNTATANLLKAQAKENALLAAYIGIGQLQKFAGPDQRVTATADIGRIDDGPDQSTQIDNYPAVNILNRSSTIVPTPLSPTTAPYPGVPYNKGGTRYWTAVFGQGISPGGTKQTGPLDLYTRNPSPLLLNYLVSGNENTPLMLSTNGTGLIAPPNTQNYINYAANTTAITSKNSPDQTNWSALTNDITITGTPATSSAIQPAVVLVGPNSAFTNNLTSVTIKTGPGGPSTNLAAFPSGFVTNLIVAPLVNITIPPDTGNTSKVTGRYAFWVGDEGVKAKYNITDPYAGQGNLSATGATGQLSRYRYESPLRTGIDRMTGFGSYANVSSSTSYSANATTSLSKILEPSQVLLADPNMVGVVTPTLPKQTMQMHFHDFTTYSYGVLADTLRGGLRYDLTAAFEPTVSGGGLSPVFTDPNNGLVIAGSNSKFILPPDGSAGSETSTITTEPNVKGIVNNPMGGAPVDASQFHGPAMGPKWGVLQSWYNLAAKTAAGTPVVMRAATANSAGITPVILQGRIRFGQFTNSNQQNYVSVNLIFVLANPYNFPITAPPGGLDLGFRINTDTGWEWGADLTARNNDRNNILMPFNHGSGIYVALGYDQTMPLLAHGNETYLSTSIVGAPGVGRTPSPGYYPFLKNPVSFPQAYSDTQSGGYLSILDNVAFHIQHGQDSTFQPGEAKAYILSPSTNLNAFFAVGPGYAPISGSDGGTPGIIVAAYGSSASTGATYAYRANQIVPILLSPAQVITATPTYAMRDTGVNTALAEIQSNPTGNPFLATPPSTYTGVNTTWPSVQYGYISTMFPAPACTLELRFDNTEPTITQDAGHDNSPLTTMSLPGTNVLQSITNMDLSGDGVPGHPFLSSLSAFPDPYAYQPPFAPSQGYRRQYLNSPTGSMPVFLSGYNFAMIMPGNLTPAVKFYVNTSGILGSHVTDGVEAPPGLFDPAADVSGSGGTQGSAGVPNFRIFTDYNLRAANMALPPYIALNPVSTNGPAGVASSTVNYKPYSNDISNSTTRAFATVPPYARVYDEGHGSDDSLVTEAQEATFNQASLSGISGFAQGNDAAWGYSLGGNTVSNSDGTTSIGGGQEFVPLYGLPMRSSQTPTTITNPNGATPTNVSGHVSDVPVLGIAQLRHADVTADDVWASVGYQPGIAITNSYSSPYVQRDRSVQSVDSSGRPLQNLSAHITNSTLQIKNLVTGSTLNNVSAYDISYLMNVALWDRYFFSSIVQDGVTTTPANTRLVYAAGYTPTQAAQQLGVGRTSAVDPSTGLSMFSAYAPARYLMIDGAFNINSTSVEAWRAVLSALRGVGYNSSGSSNTAGGVPQANVTNFARVQPLPVSGGVQGGNTSLGLENSNGTAVNKPLVATANALGYDSAAGKDAQSYAGFRQLSDYEIDVLAVKIVQMVRSRGPFLSLAQFINRRLGTPGPVVSGDSTLALSVSGTLQAAIDVAPSATLPTLNYLLPNVPVANTTVNWYPQNSPGTANLTIYPDGQTGMANPYPNAIKNIPFNTGGTSLPSNSANPFSKLAGIPGWLTQGDILEAIGTILSARSDTFLIRSYGEVLNGQINQNAIQVSVAADPTLVESRAWCEMVVQRVPDYIATDSASLNDPSTTTGVNAPNPALGVAGSKSLLSPTNNFFGRRFRIVSVRWLSPNDI